MTSEKIDLLIGLIGDDHVLSLFNIQDDSTLRRKFDSIVPLEWKDVIQFKIKNYGVVGDCTTDLLNKLEGTFIEQLSNLDYIIICVGTNDVLLDTPITEIVSNFEKILSILNKCGPIPIFCTLIPISKKNYSEKVVDLNSIMTIFCAENNIKVIDLNMIFNDGKEKLERYFDLGDGVHLTREGYLQMADTLLLRVVEIIIKEYQDYQNKEFTP
ncbi:MAG: SGNH/GDSL hydrolase family protein [Promethearchaeota archaeon]